MSIRVQILASVMHAKIDDITTSMNLQTDAVIVNQCDKTEYDNKKGKHGTVEMYSYAERGVGRSRNIALLHADADIVVFADEDIRYDDGYGKIIADEFSAHPEADMIVFNVKSLNPERRDSPINQWHRIGWHNALRHGTFKFAVRREVLLRHNVWFSLLFGGGAMYMSGEDSLFIHQCRKSGMKIYGSDKRIATVKHDTSTWFKGYTDQYFHDRGALYAALYPHLYPVMLVILYLRKITVFSLRGRFIYTYKLSLGGANEYRKSR